MHTVINWKTLFGILDYIHTVNEGMFKSFEISIEEEERVRHETKLFHKVPV